MRKGKQGVIDTIGDPRLTALVRGDGYHYFVYDDGRLYDTKSIYTMYFSTLTFATWVRDGRVFLAEMIERSEVARTTPLPKMFKT